MRNIFIIALIVVAIGYMFLILFDKYENIKETSAQNQKITQAKPIKEKE